MPKKIVLFSDGTGNSAAKAQKTNVWRMFQALDHTRVDQIAKYDDGVGTSKVRYLALLGGAFGWGLKRNVLDLYHFVCQNYQPGDDICGFGFSRGAFTIRVLVDLIATEGLVTSRSQEELVRNAAAAYRHYRGEKFKSHSPFVVSMRWLRDVLIRVRDRIKGHPGYAEVAAATRTAGRAEVPIRFLGLWDTVEAYGIPIGELKRGIDLVLWPMVFGDLVLSPRVKRACHALSLDDERSTFRPLLWDESEEARMVAEGQRQRQRQGQVQVRPGRITQVWFAGVHSNVGGGYPEDQLSLVSLDWMMNEAITNGLVLDGQAVAEVAAQMSPFARRYDSRAGLAAYYRYMPRRMQQHMDSNGRPILPIVHWSVVMRMAFGSDRYAPISLPSDFWVLAPDGELLPMEGAPQDLTPDSTKEAKIGVRPAAASQERVAANKAQLGDAIKSLMRPDRDAAGMVWDTVFWRRCVYWLTLLLTLRLASYPIAPTLFTRIGGAMADKIGLGAAFHGQWQRITHDFDAGARGPLSNIVDSLSALIPAYAAPWINALKAHPLEFGSVVAGILLCLAGSKVLDARIHDRAWLAWHDAYREDYVQWAAQAQKGWRNLLFAALGIALAFLVLAFLLSWAALVQLELALLVAGLLVLLLLHWAIGPVAAPAPRVGLAALSLPSTAALRLGRLLRNNRVLGWIGTWVFGYAVPVAFALLLVLAGLGIANRAVFDVVSASGRFCASSLPVEQRLIEHLGTARTEFQTSARCSATGLVLKEGRRYRITLVTPGDWFDRNERTDVAGMPADGFLRVAATPLKRWWTADWFKPIARIGTLGNDEYLLDLPDGFEPHAYPACPPNVSAPADGPIGQPIGDDAARTRMGCAPTPTERGKVITEIKARTTGELFLYVNDAVLMWPPSADYFYRNNRGTAQVSVEPVPAR